MTLVISPESRYRRSAACCNTDQTDKELRMRSEKRANRRTRCSPKGGAHARNNGKRRRQAKHKMRSREARRTSKSLTRAAPRLKTNAVRSNCGEKDEMARV